MLEPYVKIGNFIGFSGKSLGHLSIRWKDWSYSIGVSEPQTIHCPEGKLTYPHRIQNGYWSIGLFGVNVHFQHDPSKKDSKEIEA